MKKTFNIGEYSVGGTIKVELKNKQIFINICNYKTNNILFSHVFNGNFDNQFSIFECLNEYTSSYYSSEIMEFVCNSYKKINNLNL